ncbi:hypothetical protein BJ742DRAFT_59921 [Cladochytrium replicatum]|nr:hypothetical protein BJ742DRAFT_59921 [Cladochytrium replicatum]
MAIDVLEWWRSGGLALQIDHRPMDDASFEGHVSVLERPWFGVTLVEKRQDGASACGHIEFLDWGRGLDLKLSDRAMDQSPVYRFAWLVAGKRPGVTMKPRCCGSAERERVHIRS